MWQGKETPVFKLPNLVPSIKWGSFSIERFEDSFANARGDVFAPHRHDLYEVFWISKGRGFCTVDFQRYEIGPPMLVFVAPGQVHSWNLIGPFAGYVLLFTNDFFAIRSIDATANPLETALFAAPRSGPPIRVSDERSQEFSRLFEKLEAEFRDSLPNQDMALHAYLRLLMIEAKRISEVQLGGGHKDESAGLLTKRFLQLVERNFLTPGSVMDYAEVLGVTTNHLIETTKHTMGRPAGKIIRERVLLEAKRLLRYSERSVSDIAYDLGFEDHSYFSRFFRKNTGMCPTEFRERQEP
jgi:AraC-like DNA-binding protein